MYVGLAKNIRARWAAHRHRLRKGIHQNRHLQRAYDKFGDIEFEVLEKTSIDMLKEKEMMWIKKLDTVREGYNFTAGGDDTSSHLLGKKRPEHSKAMSGAGNGRWSGIPTETIKCAVLQAGYIQTAATQLGVSATMVKNRFRADGYDIIWNTPDAQPPTGGRQTKYKVIDVKKRLDLA